MNIPLLLQLRRAAFFSLDSDFYKRDLCHGKYCLVCMDVRKQDAAIFVRRFLQHPQFDTAAKRMGTVARVSPSGLTVWRINAAQEMQIGWVRLHLACRLHLRLSGAVRTAYLTLSAKVRHHAMNQELSPTPSYAAQQQLQGILVELADMNDGCAVST